MLLEPPGTGKTHLATALAIAAAQAGHRVAFAPATGWITRLAEAHRIDRLNAELRKVSRYGLIVIDEVGYIPFDRVELTTWPPAQNRDFSSSWVS